MQEKCRHLEQDLDQKMALLDEQTEIARRMEQKNSSLVSLRKWCIRNCDEVKLFVRLDSNKRLLKLAYFLFVLRDFSIIKNLNGSIFSFSAIRHRFQKCHRELSKISCGFRETHGENPTLFRQYQSIS